MKLCQAAGAVIGSDYVRSGDEARPNFERTGRSVGAITQRQGRKERQTGGSRSLTILD